MTDRLLVDVDITKNNYITSQSGLGMGGEFVIKDKFLFR